MDDFKTADQLCDISVLKFGQYCGTSNVNDLATLKNMIAMIHGDLTNKMGVLIQRDFAQPIVDAKEYATFISIIVSVTRIIKDLESKLEIVNYFFSELTPSCFKKDVVTPEKVVIDN